MDTTQGSAEPSITTAIDSLFSVTSKIEAKIFGEVPVADKVPESNAGDKVSQNRNDIQKIVKRLEVVHQKLLNL
jgi:hypothetical protein